MTSPTIIHGEPVFGESPTSIRLPAELIVALGLALLYPALRDLVNRQVALMAFVALCFENSIFWLTRDDVGPSALELFFKCAGLFAVARFGRSSRRGWILVLLLTLGLGVFNKLNYIWVVNAVAVVSVIVVIRQRRELRDHLGTLAIWLGGLVVIYGCFGWYYFANHINTAFGGSGSGLTQPWGDYSVGIERIISGTWFYAYALAPMPVRTGVFWIVIGLFAAGTLASTLSARRNVPIACLALTTLLIAAQILLTKQATAGWHYIAIFPFVFIVAAYGVWAPISMLRFTPPARRVALVLATLVPVVYSGVLMDHYFHSLHREPIFAAWSPAIYPLAAYLSTQPGTVITTDWGIFNPLFALHPSHRFDEYAFALASPIAGTRQAVAQQVAAIPGPKLIVSHVDADQLFAGSNAHLQAALGPHLHLIHVVDGPGNVPVFDVYEYLAGARSG